MERNIKQERGSRPRLSALVVALLATAILIVLIVVGSRGLRDFDAALIGYAVSSVFMIGALAYRYTLWIGRPPTWRYFKAGWVNFLSLRNFRRYTLLIPQAWWTDIFAQTFILKRSFLRWIMHMCIFWGVIISLMITFPLTFGWLRFTLVSPAQYQI
ncbi:hypothetical protein KSD_54360 [Ktedonobacter sp. SOSP1-85]|uniref:hypothetical protein n=1 Tax=Ktedonobacter sp. SOSP1-85 TaxID=2778367 RepID=UPI001915403E|nr:hypothetical protein [Ktedonobacter sp. SOSP1-85]GHO77665.1 hypothetical protein KSD_54360 [Ktedonobacter sp. SOSP1-85]